VFDGTIRCDFLLKQWLHSFRNRIRGHLRFNLHSLVFTPEWEYSHRLEKQFPKAIDIKRRTTWQKHLDRSPSESMGGIFGTYIQLFQKPRGILAGFTQVSRNLESRGFLLTRIVEWVCTLRVTYVEFPCQNRITIR
jgi:hypothetical protein